MVRKLLMYIPPHHRFEVEVKTSFNEACRIAWLLVAFTIALSAAGSRELTSFRICLKSLERILDHVNMTSELNIDFLCLP